ncbi:MAG: hypothetical protein WCD35_08585 [Mycobacteriales bacterium]
MGVQRSSTPVVGDACVLLGRFAGLLADDSALPEALQVLVEGFGLRSAVVRSASGELLAAAGGVVHTLSLRRSQPPAEATLELPVHGRSGHSAASLTLVGARPSQLPALRTAAAVIGLALAPGCQCSDLLATAEDERDELADGLHDGPVQSLVVARYASDAAVRGGDAVLARDAVQQALVEVRRHLWHLRPRGAAGLLEALQQLSDQLVQAGGTAIGVVGDVEAAGALRGVPAVTAYRLVQAVAKADAGPVRVALRRDGSQLMLDVDGGAPLPSPERWVRRAQVLGGDLSAPAGRLRLALPYPEARTQQ